MASRALALKALSPAGTAVAGPLVILGGIGEIVSSQQRLTLAREYEAGVAAACAGLDLEMVLIKGMIADRSERSRVIETVCDLAERLLDQKKNTTDPDDRRKIDACMKSVKATLDRLVTESR